jgi:signal transduction histidine kinase
MTDFIDEANQKIREEQISRRRRGEFDSYEIVFTRKDGQKVSTVVSPQPVFDDVGHFAGAFAVITDITERVRAEEALKEYSTRLEGMVGERTRALEDAQEQLVRREKLATLGQLAGGVGHELRNPLGVISNVVYYLQMVLASENADETVKEYLEIISVEVRNATKIVSDLLDFSRTKSAARERADVSALVERALERQPPPANVRVTTEIPSGLPPVYVDPGQIEQVLTNLVTNACQAMPDGGELTIGAIAGEDEIALSVSDTGCGISEENLDKLFEPLFTTKPQGIGLGLALSRNLVEANGGSIQVKSDKGKGSTFAVVLPVRERELIR